MKVLVIGSGGREHALAWRLSHSESVHEVFAAPGNPGISEVATIAPLTGIPDYVRFARENAIDLTVVGPEAPLVDGIVDQFRAAGLTIFGPTAEAAQLEGSKAFSKDFMMRAGVPTARYRVAVGEEDARRALDEFGFPLVLKADGLAAGKGVIIAADRAEAEFALTQLRGSRLVMEEFLYGEEVSYIVLTDGKTAIPFAPTQDHKAAFDGDTGPNTGGMGAYRDARILTPEQDQHIRRTVIEPVLACMAEEGRPFSGFLYAGLMMTASGPRVLEFNVRLGDPETQPLMCGLETDLAPILFEAARGNLSGAPALTWSSASSVCVVLAAQGYPGKIRTGDAITGIERAQSTGGHVFQAGTRLTANGELQTGGGRVLGVTAEGPELRSAAEAAYAAAREIRFEGMHYRTDIGAKGLRRY